MNEREALLRKRAEERNLQHLLPKKRARKKSNIKFNSSTNNNNNIDDDDDDTNNNDSEYNNISINNNKWNNNNKRNTKSNNNIDDNKTLRDMCNKKKRKYKNKNKDESSSSSSESDGRKSDDDEDEDEDLSDDTLSEDENEYDLSTLSEYIWLIGKVHQDSEDKKKYITTRVDIDTNGYIVAYRQQVTIDGNPVGKESKNSYHIADIVKYTNTTQQVNTNFPTLSSTSHASSSSTSEAISNSLKCEIIGCDEDQYDVCGINCKKMLCSMHYNNHADSRSCHLTTVNMIYCNFTSIQIFMNFSDP